MRYILVLLLFTLFVLAGCSRKETVSPAPNKTYFLRIKQVDANGKAVYSKTIRVKGN